MEIKGESGNVVKMSLPVSVLQIRYDFMKLITLIRGCAVGTALAGFALSASVQAGTNTDAAVNKASRAYGDVAKPAPTRVVLVEVTGSRIPQRVVLSGQQATSGSPMYVIQGQELLNTGATSIGGLLALEPSITVRRGHQ